MRSASPAGAEKAAASVIERIALYDPEAIREALDADDDGAFVLPGDLAAPPAAGTAFSVEEAQWRRTLLQIADDPRGPMRDVLIGTSAMADRVGDLDVVAPHFGAVTGLVRRAVVASSRTGTRLRFPPICLLGPPGIGKTFYAKRLALALGDVASEGVHFVEVPMNMLNDRGRISGFSMAYRGARVGDLALAVLAKESRTSGPLIFFDEIDKVDPRERLHDVLLSVLEPVNARVYIDEYLTAICPLRMDHAHVVATANDLASVPAPLLDRMLVVDVGPPVGDDLLAVIRSVYASSVESYGERFCPFVDEGVLARLETMSPRRMRRMLDLAIPVAIELGRWSLDESDLAAVAAMIPAREVARFGFTR